MGGLFARWFNKPGRDESATHVKADSVIGVAAAQEGDASRAEYEEFCANFCFRPRKNLMKFLAANNLDRVCKWLHWSTPEPEPKAFVRFGVEATRKGIKVWEQPGLTFYLKGRGPSAESQACLSILAQVLSKPIKLLVETEPNVPVQVLLFEAR